MTRLFNVVNVVYKSVYLHTSDSCYEIYQVAKNIIPK